ncbi:MAG: aminoglycoside phosphotransferase family protein [Oscillospiraceae bacterium]|jgi:Ser/Thr protein kinase RdoA (MazF antagonist)|nr:aminoglycoside phosphotransferase family protein [Oscillospiraceae bacterium]
MHLPIDRFVLVGAPLAIEPWGSGHINQTHRITTDAGRIYILQQINHHVFRDVAGLMANIEAVTGYLRGRVGDPRCVLCPIPTAEGKLYCESNGDYWRAYDFVKDTISIDRPDTPEDFARSATAFGQFQRQLADFPAHTLKETIPGFHDTPRRYRALHEAIARDALGRAASVRAEIDFALAREGEADAMLAMQRAGRLPLRVTHNDTKLNNVLFDAITREPVCVIDLDTVMPGLVGNDFGDSIRFGASTAAEDERDLSRVKLSLPMYDAYTKAFLAACGDALTPEEIETLPLGAKLMTLECGVRFLTDHLEGDAYFRVHREGQNLDRCRTQFKLVAEMEGNWERMGI